MKTILIGIQARSDSQRLPNKARLQIGWKTLLEWVVDACVAACRYLRRDSEKLGINVKTALLTPVGDPLAQHYQSLITVFQGPKEDVLGRFVAAAKEFNADYVVRITADCVAMQSFMIAKAIRAAILKDVDYVTNTHYRSFREGLDCEVISLRLLTWLDENAKTPQDREHVTTLIAPDKPFPFKDSQGRKSICHILNTPLDESDLKTSIDTKEEYDAAKENFERLEKKKHAAKTNGIFIV